jgi:integrase
MGLSGVDQSAKWLRGLDLKLDLPKLTFQVIRRTMATLSQTKGTVKDTQGMLRHSRLPTTTDVYMQVISDGVKQMIDSMHDELRNRQE